MRRNILTDTIFQYRTNGCRNQILNISMRLMIFINLITFQQSWARFYFGQHTTRLMHFLIGRLQVLINRVTLRGDCTQDSRAISILSERLVLKLNSLFILLFGVMRFIRKVCDKRWWGGLLLVLDRVLFRAIFSTKNWINPSLLIHNLWIFFNYKLLLFAFFFYTNSFLVNIIFDFWIRS